MTCNVQQKLNSKISKTLKVCYFCGIEKFDGFLKNLKMYLLGEWPGHHFDQRMGKKLLLSSKINLLRGQEVKGACIKDLA